MARRIRSSPAAHSLPKVSFEKVEDEVSTQPGGVHDQQARSYGYNDFSEFHMPDHYIQHIEPLESDLARQVEYDMDEQDQEWLDQVNADRKKEQLDKVSYEAFEIIMDRLEKEWFDLTKNIPKPDLAMPSEDSTCAVCDDSEGENSNAIVFCDGCNLAVHQDCYGVPYIPEGQWLCRKCTVSPEIPVQCILCPNEGGAFKQTVHGEWVHLLCAIWVPETRVANEVFMEPITGVEKISKQRWKLKCNICDIRQGACIQCAKTSCFLAFHATCARKEKLLLPMKSTQGAEPAALTCYCERHLSREQAEARAIALAAEESHSGALSHNQTSKSARAYAKTYKPGPPLVPALIVNRILSYIGKVSMRKKQELLWMVCRYWSLKREARRGAPLLKRLHLEPWTASAGGKIQTDEEKRMKLEQLLRLREDLVKVRSLAELCRKRETRKYRQAEIIHRILSQSLFLHEEHLRMVFERITSIDRQDYFKTPVSKSEVPDYFDIIKNPMCWSIIEAKLDRHEYWDVQAFKNDVDLVVDNAITYNKAGTPFYRTALRIRTVSEAILRELDELTRRTGYSESVNGQNESGGSASARYTIGDLEPPIEILELLVSADVIKPDMNIELDHDPIVSLFNYEFARMKPPPTPPPPPPPKVRKPKRDRKAEYERAKAKKEATGTLPIAVDSILGSLSVIEPGMTEAAEPPANAEISTSLHAPRTRRARAAAAAFEAEAQGEGSQSAVAPGAEQVSIQEPEEWPISLNTKRKKRASLPLPGLSGGPQVVVNVDSRSAFRMFNDGWILPSDQKRGGRQNMDRQVLPPKKRARTDTVVSRFSTFSTSASDNRTLPQSPSAPLSRRDALDADSELPSTISARFSSSGPMTSGLPSVVKDDIIPPGNIVQGPNGTLVIERLDTPAIRRQKNLLRKAEKQRLMTTTISESTLLPSLHVSLSIAPSSPGMPTEFPESSSRNEAGPSSRNQRATKLEAPEIESELSSLSEFGSEEVINQKLAQSIPAGPEPVLRFPGVAVLDEAPKNEQRPPKMEAGTLVWAKSNSFPWWPAVIHEENDLGVPPVLREKCQQARGKRKPIPLVVQFFDKTQSWQVLFLDKLKLLGEDGAVDDQLNKQKFRNDAQREECQAAYREAIAAIDIDTDSDHDEERGISQV